MPRILRNLKINEVSGVDRGAGRGVKIMLMKRDVDEIDWDEALDVVKIIREENGKFNIYSEDGSKKLGSYGTKAEAVERLRQIEGHKDKREFSQEQRDRAADSGAALPDGLFPIKNKQDLHNAIQAIGRAKNSAKAKAHIKSRARALGASDLIPDTWKRDDEQESDMTVEEIKKMLDDAVNPLKVELAKRDDELRYFKMSDKAKAHYDKLDDDAKKRFAVKKPEDQNAEANDHDADDKKKRDTSDIDKALNGLKNENVELRKQLDSLLLSKQQGEFRKRAVEVGLKEEDGETMRKAYDGDLEAQSALHKRFSETMSAFKAQAKTGVIFAEFGKSGPDKPASAYQEIEAKAAELRKLDPKLSSAQAFAKAYADPANRDIVAREKAESENRLAKIAAVTGT